MQTILPNFFPKRAATVVANEQTECYVLGKDEFDVIIGPLKEQLEDRARMRLIQQARQRKCSPSSAREAAPTVAVQTLPHLLI